MTILLVQNLPLTSKEKFRFGLASPGMTRPKRNFSFEVNGRFSTSGIVTLYNHNQFVVSMDEVSIQHGADVDPVDKDGFTPLHAAAAAGALLVVQGFANLLFQCAIILKRPSRVQGDHSGCVKPPVDFKTKVLF